MSATPFLKLSYGFQGRLSNHLNAEKLFGLCLGESKEKKNEAARTQAHVCLKHRCARIACTEADSGGLRPPLEKGPRDYRLSNSEISVSDAWIVGKFRRPTSFVKMAV